MRKMARRGCISLRSAHTRCSVLFFDRRFISHRAAAPQGAVPRYVDSACVKEQHSSLFGHKRWTRRALSGSSGEHERPLVSHIGQSAAALGDEAAVHPDVITEEQANALLGDLEPVFRRKRYERGHWDSVIEDYKESERVDGTWSPMSQAVIDTLRRSQWLRDYGAAAPWLPVHAIDLSPGGFIRPHVDSVKFSGGVVAGLSLLSSAVMRLSRETDDAYVELLLPPRSLYVLRGAARYEWAHEILPNNGEPILWRGQEFARGRRISLIFRDELVGPAPEPHVGTIGMSE